MYRNFKQGVDGFPIFAKTFLQTKTMLITASAKKTVLHGNSETSGLVTVSVSEISGLVTAPAPETFITHTSYPPAPYEPVMPAMM